MNSNPLTAVNLGAGGAEGANTEGLFFLCIISLSSTYSEYKRKGDLLLCCREKILEHQIAAINSDSLWAVFYLSLLPELVAAQGAFQVIKIVFGFPALWPLTSYSPSLSLYFLICNLSFPVLLLQRMNATIHVKCLKKTHDIVDAK